MKYHLAGLALVGSVLLAGTSSFAKSVAFCRPPQKVTDVHQIETFLKSDWSKGEYETKADFGARLQKGLTALGPVTAAVWLPQYAGKYDADKQEFELDDISLSFTYLSTYSESGIYDALVVKSVNGPARSYVGQNAFGVSKDISVTTSENVAVAFHQRGGLGTTRTHLRFHMDRVTAPAERAALLLAIYGNAAPPYRIEDMNNHQPTIDSPYETHDHTLAVIIKPICAAIVDTRNGNIVANFDPTSL